MGYRSTVALAVDAEIMPAFMAALAQEPEAMRMVFSHHDTLLKDYCGEGNLLVVWDSIKWYESYPEIAKIEQFITDPSDFGFEDDPGEHFRFVRIGEEMDDNATEGWGFDDLYISRSLSF